MRENRKEFPSGHHHPSHHFWNLRSLMPQHNPAGDATSAPHHEPQAGELHQARGQPTVSPTDPGELLEAASTPDGIETPAEYQAPFSPASTQGSVTVQADQRRVCIRS